MAHDRSDGMPVTGTAPSPAVDPRTHPDLLRALESYRLSGHIDPPDAALASTASGRLELAGNSHASFEEFFANVRDERAGDGTPELPAYRTVFAPVKGRQVALHVFDPPGPAQPRPAVLYLHGGGMTILNTLNKVHHRWAAGIAEAGVVSIAVDFTNAWNDGVWSPFPTGLGDSVAAVIWVHEHREELGVSGIVLHGVSGGGNLALATTLRLKRLGKVHYVDGVYATVPYVSGAYDWPRERMQRELPSLIEFDGYYTSTKMMSVFAELYDADRAHRDDPECWPLAATLEDLADLPSHVITVNELDPLRDEGLVYAHRLQAAGTPTVVRINPGLTHGADTTFRIELASLYDMTQHDIAQFALRVQP